MKVIVNDISQAITRTTTLNHIDRLAFGSGIRSRLVAMWEDRDGFTLQVMGPFEVSSDACNKEFAWRWPILVAPIPIREGGVPSVLS